ncbi:MAG: hypothetical protein JOZ23_01045 [Mycobacterium sp.]|nr:hypothetical protein [Mycobacterium sp.]
MPSIPQSLLWISLVVLWLFVLVPMLTSKRDAVRRTSDVALATRVLNSAAGSRLLRRTKPAAGHRSDPDWQPEEDQYDDPEDDLDDDDVGDAAQTRSAVMTVAVAAKVEITESDQVEVQVVDGVPVPVVGGAEVADAAVAVVEAESVAEDKTNAGDPEAEFNEGEAGPWTDYGSAADTDKYEADEYEYVEDTSGLELEGDCATTTAIPVIPRRQRYDSRTAAVVGARKYRFRKRAVVTMVLSLAVSAAVAFLLTPVMWWICGGMAAVTLFYLGYLRRQTRIEQRVRRRRAERMARSRLGVENAHDREFEVTPARLRRPGAVVLEIDDEDPVFENLDYAPVVHHYDLPRAAGQ